MIIFFSIVIWNRSFSHALGKAAHKKAEVIQLLDTNFTLKAWPLGTLISCNDGWTSGHVWKDWDMTLLRWLELVLTIFVARCYFDFCFGIAEYFRKNLLDLHYEWIQYLKMRLAAYFFLGKIRNFWFKKFPPNYASSEKCTQFPNLNKSKLQSNY